MTSAGAGEDNGTLEFCITILFDLDNYNTGSRIQLASATRGLIPKNT